MNTREVTRVYRKIGRRIDSPKRKVVRSLKIRIWIWNGARSWRAGWWTRRRLAAHAQAAGPPRQTQGLSTLIVGGASRKYSN